MMKSIRTKVLNQIVAKYHGLKAVVKGCFCQITCYNHGLQDCYNHGLQAVVISPSNKWALALIFSFNL